MLSSMTALKIVVMSRDYLRAKYELQCVSVDAIHPQISVSSEQ